MMPVAARKYLVVVRVILFFSPLFYILSYIHSQYILWYVSTYGTSRRQVVLFFTTDHATHLGAKKESLYLRDGIGMGLEGLSCCVASFWQKSSYFLITIVSRLLRLTVSGRQTSRP